MPKCKNCNNLYNLSNKDDVIVGKWCPKINDSPHLDMERNCEHYKAMTNADRIRSMTDQEMANWFDAVTKDVLGGSTWNKKDGLNGFGQKARDSMERLTTNKSVSDMSMVELAHNSCYVDSEGNARYRDYEMEMDARDFARNLMVTLTKDELPVDDTEFDEEILDNLTIDPFSDVRGLIAVFYRNMWAMADLREKLKRDEDAEEQGLLLRLPCKVGDTVWVVTSPFNVFDDIEYDENMKDEVYEAFISSVTFYECGEQYRIYAKATNHFIGAYFRKCDFGKTVFLTKEEAEAKLKEMEGEHGEQIFIPWKAD